MASVDVSALSAVEKDQLVCTYAALLLHDSGLDIDVSLSSNSNLDLLCFRTRN